MDEQVSVHDLLWRTGHEAGVDDELVERLEQAVREAVNLAYQQGVRDAIERMTHRDSASGRAWE